MELSLKEVTEAFVSIRRLVKATVPHPECDDVASDAFLGWWRGVTKGRFRSESSLSTYAHSIAKNKVTDWIRRKQRMSGRQGNWRNHAPLMEALFVERFHVSKHERSYETKTLFSKFMEGIGVCTTRQAEAIRLCYEKDLTHKEGAEVMGISKRMFATHLHNGLRKMIVRFCDEVRYNKNARQG